MCAAAKNCDTQPAFWEFEVIDKKPLAVLDIISSMFVPIYDRFYTIRATEAK